MLTRQRLDEDGSESDVARECVLALHIGRSSAHARCGQSSRDPGAPVDTAAQLTNRSQITIRSVVAESRNAASIWRPPKPRATGEESVIAAGNADEHRPTVP